MFVVSHPKSSKELLYKHPLGRAITEIVDVHGSKCGKDMKYSHPGRGRSNYRVFSVLHASMRDKE